MEVNKVTSKEEKPDHFEVTLETADKKTKEVLASLDGKAITEEPPEDATAKSAAAEEEEKIEINTLPKAVASAVKTKFPKAEMASAEKGDEDGKPVFEVSIKNGKQSIDVTLTPEGKILLVEKAIDGKDLPKAVATALASKYPKATIKLAEELIRDDKLSGYEITVVTADNKTHEVEFDPKGKLVEEEKK